jgi:hypothetical protein
MTLRIAEGGKIWRQSRTDCCQRVEDNAFHPGGARWHFRGMPRPAFTLGGSASPKTMADEIA